MACWQVVVTLLDPLQEGGPVAAAAVMVLEQLVIHARHLLGDKLKTLPPLPQAVEGLGNGAYVCMLLPTIDYKTSPANAYWQCSVGRHDL